LTKEERIKIIEGMLYTIEHFGKTDSLSIKLIAEGFDPDYIVLLEKVAKNIWEKYGDSIFVFLDLDGLLHLT